MINNELKSLKETFNEALELRNLDVKKLAELTDIPVHYLSALASGDPRKLPASPYVRGYLVKIADVLKIDRESLIRVYKQEMSFWPAKTSGPEDKLPPNRYALKSKKKLTAVAIGGAAILAVIIFFIFQFSSFLGNPKLNIDIPLLTKDGVYLSKDPVVKITGSINPSDKLTINGEEILSKSDGTFEKDLLLQQGTYGIVFKVKRFLGKEITENKLIDYSPDNIPQ